MQVPRAIRYGVGAAAAVTMVWLARDVVRGAEWYMESKIQAQGSFDDNVRLEPDNEIEAVGAILSPEVKLGRRNESFDVSVLGRIDANGFASDEDLSSVDERIVFNASKMSMRGKLGLSVDFNRDTTLTTEETDTGNFTETARVQTISVGPTWSYQLSPNDTLDLTGNYTNTAYDTDELTDFQFVSGAANITHAVGPMDSLLGGVFVARFEADDATDTVSDIVGAQIGWGHQFSDVFRVQGLAGLEHVRTRFRSATGDEEDDTLSYRLDLGLTYKFDDVTRIEVAASRKTEPSGGGTVVTRNRAQLSLTHRFSPMLSFRADGSVIENEAEQRSGVDQRTFLVVQPSLTWSLNRDWDVSASYRFRTQDFENGDSASSNAAFLTLTYRLPRSSWAD